MKLSNSRKRRHHENDLPSMFSSYLIATCDRAFFFLSASVDRGGNNFFFSPDRKVILLGDDATR